MSGRFFVPFLMAGLLFGQNAKDVRKVAKQGSPALPALQHFLINPDLKVRLEAVRAIVEIGGPRTLDALIEATHDNESQVQIAAVNGLVNVYVPGYVRTGFAAPIRKMGSDIRSRFSDPDGQVIDGYIKVRADVIQAVGRLARSGSSLDSRANAARAAGVLRGKQAVPDLLEALRSRDSDVLLETLIALEKIHDSAACPGLHYLLNDLDEKIQSEAIEAQGVLGCKEAIPEIRSILKRADRDRVRHAALSTLAMMPEPTDRATFTSFLESPDERTRAEAAEGFARLASIDDARNLQAAFERETRNLPRMALAFALVMDGNLATTEFAPLRYLVYSINNNTYRTNAVAYLKEAARNPEVRHALVNILPDATRDEKVALAEVFAVSGDRDSVAVLEKLSKDPDELVASESMRQMRNLQARI